MALNSERHILMWNMQPHPVPKEAPAAVSVTQIISILQAQFNGKKAFLYIDANSRIVTTAERDKAKNCIFIADFIDVAGHDAWAVLITRGDPDAAHPSFINPVKLTVKPVVPGADEVQGWSAHMVISKTPNKHGMHRACFERMPGVGSTLVTHFFEKLVDLATEDDPSLQYDRPIKKGKKTEIVAKRYKLRLGISHVSSSSLENDIQRGVLSEITLIRKNVEYAGPGDPTKIISVKGELKIKPRQIVGEDGFDLVESITAWGRTQNYNEVQFRIDRLPGNTSVSPRFDLEKINAMETLYARSKRIDGFSAMLETCYAKANTEISRMMAKELTDESNW